MIWDISLICPKCERHTVLEWKKDGRHRNKCWNPFCRYNFKKSKTTVVIPATMEEGDIITSKGFVILKSRTIDLAFGFKTNKTVFVKDDGNLISIRTKRPYAWKKKGWHKLTPERQTYIEISRMV